MKSHSGEEAEEYIPEQDQTTMIIATLSMGNQSRSIRKYPIVQGGDEAKSCSSRQSVATTTTTTKKAFNHDNIDSIDTVELNIGDHVIGTAMPSYDQSIIKQDNEENINHDTTATAATNTTTATLKNASVDYHGQEDEIDNENGEELVVAVAAAASSSLPIMAIPDNECNTYSKTEIRDWLKNLPEITTPKNAVTDEATDKKSSKHSFFDGIPSIAKSFTNTFRSSERRSRKQDECDRSVKSVKSVKSLYFRRNKNNGAKQEQEIPTTSTTVAKCVITPTFDQIGDVFSWEVQEHHQATDELDNKEYVSVRGHDDRNQELSPSINEGHLQDDGDSKSHGWGENKGDNDDDGEEDDDVFEVDPLAEEEKFYERLPRDPSMAHTVGSTRSAKRLQCDSEIKTAISTDGSVRSFFSSMSRKSVSFSVASRKKLTNNDDKSTCTSDSKSNGRSILKSVLGPRNIKVSDAVVAQQNPADSDMVINQDDQDGDNNRCAKPHSPDLSKADDVKKLIATLRGLRTVIKQLPSLEHEVVEVGVPVGAAEEYENI